MVSGYGNVIGIAKIKVKVFNLVKDVFVFVLDSYDFAHDFLIGLDLIYEFRLCQNHEFKIYQNLKKKWVPTNNKYTREVFLNLCEIDETLKHLDTEKRSSIKKIIFDFNLAFAKNKFDVGQVKEHEAAVKLTEHRYVSRKPYRCNIIDQREIESQVNQLLEAGLIEESTSPFAAPVTLVFKKQSDGTRKKNRLCIDYTALNKLVVPESQPFPHIEDLVVKARDCNWFSVLDINSAFWSIPLREKDRYKTAFVTQSGHYNWKCLPFGLKTSPAIFQRVLRNSIKRNGLDDFAVNYIDDILVFSKNFKEHLAHLKKLISAIYKEGFRLSLAKCEFAKNRVRYLGHVIENNCTKPIFDNVIPLKNFPVPTTQKQVRQFLGKVNFYHSYIPNSAIILAPLHNLLKKNVKFFWSEKCQESFDFVIDCLCSTPCLAIFCPNKETVVYTDASNDGIGAVLKQKQADGTLKPVAFFSKKLNDSQKYKKAIFLECLAIKEALMYWRHRLLGIKFKVISDHKPLEGLNVNTKYDDELRELLLLLSQFDFTVSYMPGKENTEADCLSRNPVLDSSVTFPELKVINFIQIDEILEDQKKYYDDLIKKPNVIVENKVCYSNWKQNKKILISTDFAKTLIDRTHIHFGHIGTHQIELTLFPHFYVKEFKQLIRDHCRSCSVCIKNKSRIPAKFGKMSHFGPARRPFEYMSIDTIGGFSGYNSTQRYVHLLVDHFTRFAYVHTSKNQTTGEFVKLLNLVLKDGNKIENLLTDQYSALNSNEFKSFVKQNGIKLYFTAVDCPFSNGLNERLNQTLINRLRCKINENDSNKKKAWSTLIKNCLIEYNDTIHSVTHFSPNYLLNGVHQNFLNKLKIHVGTTLAKDREIAFKNSMKNHQANEKYYNKNKKEFDFQVNDMVYISNGNPLNRNKLSEIRSGPFHIVKKVSNVLYHVNSGIRKSESNIFHVSKLYPYHCI